MSAVKHTELPWKNEHDENGFVSGPSGLILFETLCFGGESGTKAAANAEFVVRTCNSHYELVDALLQNQEILVAMHAVELRKDAKRFLADRMDANSAAIAKAGGQS